MSAYSLLLLSGVIFLLQSSFLPFLFNGIMQPDLWLTVIALSSLVVELKTFGQEEKSGFFGSFLWGCFVIGVL